jgi:hypothetical protein
MRMQRAKQNTTSLQQRAFSRSAVLPRDHHFDTLKFVQLLKDEGFTEDQAVAMMKVLGDVIEERLVSIQFVPPVLFFWISKRFFY